MTRPDDADRPERPRTDRAIQARQVGETRQVGRLAPRVAVATAALVFLAVLVATMVVRSPGGTEASPGTGGGSAPAGSVRPQAEQPGPADPAGRCRPGPDHPAPTSTSTSASRPRP